MTDNTAAHILRDLAQRLREQADTHDAQGLPERLEKLANQWPPPANWREHRHVRLALALLDEEDTP